MEHNEMQPGGFSLQVRGRPILFSYWFLLGTLVLAGWLHLGGPLVATLFAYFALNKFHLQVRVGKVLALIFFLVVLSALGYGLGFLINRMARDLPEIAETAIPSVLEYAKKHDVHLPFSDYETLKDAAMGAVRNQVQYLGAVAKFARGATSEFLLIVIGVVIATGLFFNPTFEGRRKTAPLKNNLYSLCTEAIAERFRIFYDSFATVMGAQIVISVINTALTAVFVLSVHLPYSMMVIGTTFVCGMIPIIGNLMSNTIIFGIGFIVSPTMALVCLIFLVVVHKLEYFLNSKIVGDRIQNPFWLTLLGLILGERLMGVPGMILAPVVLNYIKVEASRIEVRNEDVPVDPQTNKV
jgi:predicted PurR-regulated permease PerM